MAQKKKQLGPTTLLGAVPVIIVTVYDEKRQNYNAITIGWTGIVNTKPPMLSISIKPCRYSHQLILENQYFTVNLVDSNLVKAADYCGVKSGKNTDKLLDLSLNWQNWPNMQDAAFIEASPVQLLCKRQSSTFLGSHDLFLAEIIQIQADAKLFDETEALHLDWADLVCYMHGRYYKIGEYASFFGFSVAKQKIRKRREKIDLENSLLKQ